MAIKKKLGKSFGYMEITGIDEINAVLKTLAPKFRNNVLKLATREGANIIAEAAKNKLRGGGHVKTGKLLRSIQVVDRDKASDTDFINLAITPSRTNGFEGYHAHLLEFGHKFSGLFKLTTKAGVEIVRSKKGGAAGNIKKKRAKKYPFMRPGYAESVQKAIGATLSRSRSLSKTLLKRELPGATIK